MSELGSTDDPRALVPGSPETVEQQARDLAAYARRAEQVGEQLKRVDVGAWSGPAAERFGTAWAREPVKWLKAAGAVEATATAMAGYAGTLRWAQGQAGQAITLWHEAGLASAAAATRYRAEVVDAAARGVPIGPFVDPGEPRREDARAVLACARNQLAETGNLIARRIDGRAVGTPGAGIRAGGSVNDLVDAVTDGWVDRGQESRNGPRLGTSVAAAQSGKLGELKAYAQLGGASWTGSARDGEFSVSGKGGFDIGAQATTGASFTSTDGLAAKAEVSAQARASVEGHADYGVVGVYGRAAGSAGLSANAGLYAGKNAVIAKAGAFAGIKGSVAGGVELGGISIGETAEGQLGAGVQAWAGYKRDPETGRFEFGGDAGLALGAGGKLGVEITVDPREVAQTARDAADAVGRTARAVESAGQHSWDDLREVASDAEDSLGRRISGLDPF